MIDFNPDDKLPINLDIVFPSMPCDPLSIDLVDVTGVHIVDIEGKLEKLRLDKDGNLL